MTTSLANPFAEFLLLTSKNSISKGESFLICNHCFRHIFANLSPGYQDSLDDMLCTENLFAIQNTPMGP